MNRQINKRVLARLTTGLFLSAALVNPAQAWYPSHPYPTTYPGYAPYFSGVYPYHWRDMRGPGYYGYPPSRWYMRGRMNRYGDFRFDVKLRDINMADIYQAWLLFNNYGY